MNPIQSLPRPLLLLLAMALVITSSSEASGTYTSRPPVPPTETSALDRARYALGQRLFAGKVEPTGNTDAAAQRRRLSILQDRLPERLREDKDLAALAGRFTEEQLDALEYYIDRRFPDPAAYELGQRIFEGRLVPRAAEDVASQRRVLETLQEKLPKRVSRTKDLLGLAGKLTVEELAALEYFVNRRFE